MPKPQASAAAGVLVAVALSTLYARDPIVAQGPSAASFSPAYTGNYRCGSTWSYFELRSLPAKNGGVKWLVDFQRKMAFDLTGTVDPVSGTFVLTANGVRFSPMMKTKAKLTLKGSRDPEQGFLVGDFVYPDCSEFVLAPQESFSSSVIITAVQAYINNRERDTQQRQEIAGLEKKRADRIRSGWVPPELSTNNGQVVELDRGEYFEYWDATLNGRSSNAGVFRIDEVNQFLLDDGNKCLSTTDVAWRGQTAANAQINLRTTGLSRTGERSKYVVIECRRDCAGLRYWSGRVRLVHYGKHWPYPLIALTDTYSMASYQFELAFDRSHVASGREPAVRIHAWSNAAGDFGNGCRLF